MSACGRVSARTGTERRVVPIPGWSRLEASLLPVTASGLVLGVAARVMGWTSTGDGLLAVATAVALVSATVATVVALRQRRPGVDVIAVLAMAGALALGEVLAGAVIAVMLTGGQALERFAEGRARRELTALLDRRPRGAHRQEDGRLVDVPVDDVRPRDLLLVRTGEVVPVDGVLLERPAVLDESALTGESRPTEASVGSLLSSGAVNAGSPITMRASATADRSTFAGIVRLVEQAAEQRSPFVRLADRWAGAFVAVTFVVAGGAWLLSGDPVRALAVVVVATPCPLILAAPAAMVGGLSAAARNGIIVKGGGVLEALASTSVVLLDKTGTLTAGRPRVTRVRAVGELPTAELLRLAACLEQVSLHPFAPAILAAVAGTPDRLGFPTDVDEVIGQGVRGMVDGREVAVGRLSFVAPGASLPRELRTLRRAASLEGASVVHVALDGVLAGAVVLADPLRPEAPRALRLLRRLGVHHVLMVTGDRLDVAELVADAVGVDRVLAERAPAEKVDAVREAQELGRTLMVGDGINDAPALALADVGVAMGARGATAASEAADVVLTADRLEGLADAMRIARRTRRIARQSVLAGMGLSVVAMGAAAGGWLVPVVGALVQEAIDLAVIVNALRAVTDRVSHDRGQRVFPAAAGQLLAEHADHRQHLDELDDLAAELEDLPADRARMRLEALRSYLETELLPHELEEEQQLYPAIAAAFPGEDPTAPMARTHREITRHVRVFGRLLDDLPAEGLDPIDLVDSQRLLWGLHGVLALHFALEDELYAELAGVGVSPPTTAGSDPRPNASSQPGSRPAS